MSFDLADYVDVGTRIARFYERHPDGRITATPAQLVTIDDRHFLTVTASVYRTPDDPTPCIGTAWEPWPGRTPYTKDSEAMNAETSAVGRALALAGIEVRRSIASADEVRARRDQPPEPEPPAIDWPALGWHDQHDHDHRMTAVRDRIAGLPEPVRDQLLHRWKTLGYRWPLSTAHMTAWEAIVTEHEPEPAPPTSDQPAATQAQLRRIAVLCGQHDVSDRTERLELVATLAGREQLASMAELTKLEASKVIDQLEATNPAA